MLQSVSFNVEVGRGRPGWEPGLDRCLLNTRGRNPVWKINYLKPVVKITNTTGKSAWFRDFVLYVTNGVTPGSSVVSLVDVEGAVSVPSMPANLTISVRDRNINPVTYTLPPVTRFVQRAGVDLSDRLPRTTDRDGNEIPGETPTPGVVSPSNPHVVVTFPFIRLGVEESIYLDFDCSWEGDHNDYHVIQWCPAYFADTTNRVYLIMTWDANGGTLPASSGDVPVGSTHKVMYSSITQEDIPQPNPRPNYRFLRWDPDPLEISSVEEDMTFTAVWERVGGGAFYQYQKDTNTWRPIMDVRLYDKSTGTWVSNVHYKKFISGVGWVDYP